MTNKKNQHSEGYTKFLRALKKPDDEVSFILHCHLLSEYYLEQIITATINRGDLILTKGNFRYANKLLIVKALDVSEDNLLTALQHLNTIRNNCAHQMDYKITEATVDLIGRPFGKEYSKIKSEKKTLKNRLAFTLMMIIAKLNGVHDGLIKKKLGNRRINNFSKSQLKNQPKS